MIDADGRTSRSAFEAAGKTWPLSVAEGRLGCSGLAYWFEVPNGARYGLNGFATVAHGYLDLTPIWLPDAKLQAQLRAGGGVPGYVPRQDISDLSDGASRLCKPATP